MFLTHTVGPTRGRHIDGDIPIRVLAQGDMEDILEYCNENIINTQLAHEPPEECKVHSSQAWPAEFDCSEPTAASRLEDRRTKIVCGEQ